MKLLLAVAALALSLSATASFAAMDEASCSAMFAKADMNKDGMLGGDEDDAFNDAMASGGSKPKTDAMLSMQDFMAACQKGMFDNVMMQ
jgi:opacity protein-like surface antigen